MDAGAEIGEPTAVGRQSRILDVGLVVLVVAGITLSLTGFFVLRQQGERLQEQNFADLAAGRAQAIERRAASTVDRIRASAAYLATTQDLGRNDYVALRPGFRLFTAEVVGGAPDLVAIAWVPRVEGDDRDAFMRRARPVDGSPFDLTEFGPGGTIAAAAVRPYYFPIAVIGPAPPRSAAGHRSRRRSPPTRAAGRRAGHGKGDRGARRPRAAARDPGTRRVRAGPGRAPREGHGRRNRPLRLRARVDRHGRDGGGGARRNPEGIGS